MPSPSKAPWWMKDWHVKGNDRADSMADIAAALHAVPKDKATPLIGVLNNLGLIEERHIAIAQLLPQRLRNTITDDDLVPTEAVRLLNACIESSHNCAT